MYKLKVLRRMLQLFSLVVFMYQTITFLQRYHESPTVIITSQKNWDVSYRPRLLVCESKFYNMTGSRQLGYGYYSSFISGEVSGLNSSISWKGKTNLSWSEIESFLFPNINSNRSNIEFHKQTSEKIVFVKHLQPFTVCNEVVDFGQILYLGLKKDVSIYLVDPHIFTNHRLNTLSMKGENIALPHLNKSDHSSLVYSSVATTVLEKRVDKGECRQYADVSGYTMCIEKGYINYFKRLIGCVPPWFRQESNDSKIVCTTQINFKDETS